MEARMENPVKLVPDAMKALLALSASVRDAGVPARTLELVHLRASQINGCGLCVDMHARELKRAGESDERLFGVAAWRESPYFTDAERAAYVRKDVALRWHSWPATRIFPSEVEYTGLGRTQRVARRVGIAPESSCRGGLDSPVAGVLEEYGCRTLLRATYVDQSAAYAITVGVAVLRDEEARIEAATKLPVDDRVGVRPVAFPGTVTEKFGAAQRQRTGWTATGPYIVFTTSGYTDGRTRQAVPPEEILHSELWPVAQSIGGQIARALGRPPDVPRCTQGNVC